MGSFTSHTKKDFQVLTDIGALDHHIHSRWRVYPQDVTKTKQLKAGTPANTFGSWVELIPLNIIPFEFEVIGIVVEEVSASTTYFIQIGYNTINAVLDQTWKWENEDSGLPLPQLKQLSCSPSTVRRCLLTAGLWEG